MLEHDMHVRWLAENTHVGQHSVIYQVMCAASVAAVFLALEFPPLRFLNFAGDGSDDDVPFQTHAGALQRFHGVGVTDQRAFHVVDTESVDETIFDNGLRLVTEAGKKFLAARIGRVHVAVEHQVLAAARAFPTPHHVGARFLDFLPGHVEADLLERGLHVLRHLQFFAGRAGDVDHVAGHGNNFVFANFSQNPLDNVRIDAALRVGSYARHFAYQFHQFSVFSDVLPGENRPDRYIVFRCPVSVIRKLSSSRNPPPPGQ